jgi:Tfp pilus assembly protein PilV
MRTRKRAGFTLLSVMVALVMLVVGILGLARTLAVTTTVQGEAAMRTASLDIARGYMESLRARDAGLVVSEPAVRVDADGNPSATGAYTRAVEVLEESGNLKRVRVIVRAPKAMVPTVLETLIYVRTV